MDNAGDQRRAPNKEGSAAEHVSEARGARPTARQVADDIRSRQLRSYLDIVTLILAVLAIGFAIYQAIDSHRLKAATNSILDKTDGVLNTTRQVVNDASTQYVANFPDNLPKIKDLVDGTCGKFDVMADVPGYGMYSAPDDFQRYFNALLEARQHTIRNNIDNGRCDGKERPQGGKEEHPKMRLLLFSPKDRDCSLRKQFERERFLSALKTDNAERAAFLAFVDHHLDLLNGDNREKYLERVSSGGEYPKFIEYLLNSHHVVEAELYKPGIEIRYAQKPVVYMRIWNQDSAYAVFSFDHTPLGTSETEIAFRTHDPRLLATFHDIFEDYWGSATDYPLYWRNPPQNLQACPKD